MDQSPRPAPSKAWLGWGASTTSGERAPLLQPLHSGREFLALPDTLHERRHSSRPFRQGQHLTRGLWPPGGCSCAEGTGPAALLGPSLPATAVLGFLSQSALLRRPPEAWMYLQGRRWLGGAEARDVLGNRDHSRGTAGRGGGTVRAWHRDGRAEGRAGSWRDRSTALSTSQPGRRGARRRRVRWEPTPARPVSAVGSCLGSTGLSLNPATGPEGGAGGGLAGYVPRTPRWDRKEGQVEAKLATYPVARDGTRNGTRRRGRWRPSWLCLSQHGYLRAAFPNAL